MKRPALPKSDKSKPRTTTPKSMSGAVARHGIVKHASIFKNGANQAVRLPQDLRFGDEIREVRIRRLADGLLLTPVKPDWRSFFMLDVSVPEDFLTDRDDPPPQSREPL